MVEAQPYAPYAPYAPRHPSFRNVIKNAVHTGHTAPLCSVLATQIPTTSRARNEEVHRGHRGHGAKKPKQQAGGWRNQRVVVWGWREQANLLATSLPPRAGGWRERRPPSPKHTRAGWPRHRPWRSPRLPVIACEQAPVPSPCIAAMIGHDQSCLVRAGDPDHEVGQRRDLSRDGSRSPLRPLGPGTQSQDARGPERPQRHERRGSPIPPRGARPRWLTNCIVDAPRPQDVRPRRGRSADRASTSRSTSRCPSPRRVDFLLLVMHCPDAPMTMRLDCAKSARH